MGNLRILTLAHVTALFSAHTIDSDTPHGEVGPFVVQAATNEQIKRSLRGRVYQDQRKFCTQMTELGLYASWSNKSYAWIYHLDTRFHPKYDAHLPWSHKPL